MEQERIKKNSFDVFGKLLIKIQYLEDILKLYISLFNKEAKQRNKKITNLCSRDILDDT